MDSAVLEKIEIVGIEVDKNSSETMKRGRGDGGGSFCLLAFRVK